MSASGSFHAIRTQPRRKNLRKAIAYLSQSPRGTVYCEAKIRGGSARRAGRRGPKRSQNKRLASEGASRGANERVERHRIASRRQPGKARRGARCGGASSRQVGGAVRESAGRKAVGATRPGPSRRGKLETIRLKRGPRSARKGRGGPETRSPRLKVRRGGEGGQTQCAARQQGNTQDGRVILASYSARSGEQLSLPPSRCVAVYSGLLVLGRLKAKGPTAEVRSRLRCGGSRLARGSRFHLLPRTRTRTASGAQPLPVEAPLPCAQLALHGSSIVSDAFPLLVQKKTKTKRDRESALLPSAN